MIQTRKVLTGDFHLYAIESLDIKRQILCYLMDKIGKQFVAEIKPINDNKDIQTIRQAYMSTIDYYGKKYYMVIKKICNNYFTIFIDIGVTTRFNHNNPNINTNLGDIEILFCPVRLPLNAYNGTIASGTLVKNIHCNEYIFLIDNCFEICGDPTLSIPITKRLHKMDSVIKNIKRDTFITTLSFQTTEYFEFQNIDKKLQLASNDYKVNGVIFVSSKSNIIYTYKTQQPDTQEELTANFRMQPTPISDVYELYLKANKTFKKMSIACIQTMKDSLHYKALFSQQNVTSLIVKCRYVKKFNKWSPIELSTFVDEFHDIKFKMEQQ